MAAYNIGPKIGIEGEKEFRAQISRINKEYSAMESYTKAVSTAMQQQGKSQELLASKSNGLRQQLNLQQQKFRELSEALEKAKASYGENSQEVLRFEGAILDVKNTTAALQRELDATDDELRRMAAGIEDVGDSADSAEPKVLSFGDMLKAGIASGAILNTIEQVGEFIVEVGQKSIEAAADVKAANAQFSQTFGDLEDTATSALRSISKETGIAVTRLQGGYTALYAFTKSVGGDQDTALNIAQRALRAAADSAAYYDRTMEDATETLQSFLKGNYENDNALGIAASETTRNAKANELYAKSFKELTEAQKVDTLLAMVEAGNAASGALGQAAREADSWANVTGELAESWRQFLAQLGGPVMEGLIPVIQGITQGLKDMTAVSSWKQLRADVDEFQQSLDAASTALTNSASGMASTAGLAERYVAHLRELETAGLDTADAQREYAQVVELLNSLMPELNLTIDEVTHRINQNSDAILDNIKTLREQAVQQAKMAYYKSIVDSFAKAYEAQFAAEQKLFELQQQELQLKEDLAMAEALQQAANIRGDANLTARTERVIELNAALLENQKAQTEMSAEIDRTAQILASEQGKLDAATAAYEDYADAGESAAEAAAAQAEAQEALAKAYEAAKSAARESIDSQIGLFEELADKNEWSAEKIIENWEKQQKAFANYESNLKKATELGLDETLVAQLSDGSQQSMMILDALVNDTEIRIDEINAAFRDRMTAEDSLAGHLAKMETITKQGLSQIVKYAEAAGLDIVNGASNGILNNIGKYEQALKRLASRGQQAYRHEWSINSPSRVMMENSDYIVDGGVLQIQRRTGDLERAMSDLAKAGNHAYLQEQLDAVAHYPAMVAGTPGYGGTTTNTRNVAYGGISININTQPGQDAQSIADAVLRELTVRLGQEEAAF